jgi:hypothetical protein
MARLLRDKDYLRVTLSDALRELIEDNYAEWLNAEQVGQEEMISKLSQRYIIDQIFTNTTVFDTTLVYKGKKLVEYTEDDWSEATSYSVGNRVVYDDKIYQCILTSQGFVPTNVTYWIYITDNLSLYYVTLPVDEWDNETDYAVGDQVWYLDKTYTCVIANTNITPDSDSGIWGSGTSYSITGKNPDIFFHPEVAYTVGVKVVYEDVMYTCILNSTGNLPTNATYFTASATRPYWTKGDNRNPLIVRYLLDITRYHFERSIPARNVSDLIKEAYNGNSPQELGGAIGWLKRVASGKDNASLPEILPIQGLSISYGNSRKSQDNQLW